MASKKEKVRVAIIGVGNCASSLVQGIQFYKDAPDDAKVPGIMHTRLGGYHIRDIEFTLGIDVNVTKVGKDLSFPHDMQERLVQPRKRPLGRVFSGS